MRPRGNGWCRSRGFTLIEILVVVVIIAIIAAGAILSLSSIGQDRELDTESKRLVALMNYAREQAELQTREFGLYCTQHGYRFVVFNPLTNLWEDLLEDDALHPRELPEGLTVYLTVEARDVVLSPSVDPKKFAPVTPPQGTGGAISSLSGTSLGAGADSSGSSTALANLANGTSTLGSATSGTGLGASGSTGLGASSGTGLGGSSGTSTLGTDQSSDHLAPHVMIFSNGDLTSFALTLARDGTESKAIVVPDDQNRLKLKDTAGDKS